MRYPHTAPIMDLLSILITLIIVGVVLYLINTFVPIDGRIKKVINIATIVIVVIWLVKVTGILNSLRNVHF